MSPTSRRLWWHHWLFRLTVCAVGLSVLTLGIVWMPPTLLDGVPDDLRVLAQVLQWLPWQVVALKVALETGVFWWAWSAGE